MQMSTRSTFVDIPGTEGRQFSAGNNLVYDFTKANQSEPVNTGIFVVGFKTTSPNVALAQLQGRDYRHFTLILEEGLLVLYYSMKQKLETDSGFIQDNFVDKILVDKFLVDKARFNDDKHHVARVHFTTDYIYLEVPDLKLSSGASVTERTTNGLLTGKDMFDIPDKFMVGTLESNLKMPVGNSLPTSFAGCMSGAKIVLHPRATSSQPFRKSIELDLFNLINNDPDNNNNDNNLNNILTGSFPPQGACGTPLPTPGMYFVCLFIYWGRG